jgi:hypothetical protein
VVTVEFAVPPARAAVPSTVVPFLNVIVSLSGMLPAVELTIAVKVIACPRVEGFTLEVRVVVVLFSTTSDTPPELAVKVASPG